ncbi:Major facilitator, sugar transporter-like [Sergentomyia squamirostris]
MSNSVCDSEKKCDLCETENENLEDSQETLHLSVLEEICDQSIEFEDALTKVTFGKFNYCLIFMCGVNMAAVMLEILGISFVNPLAQCDLELTNWDKGVLSAIVLLGIILSSHLWGFLADTMGRRAVMMPTLFAAFFSTLLSSFSSNFWVFAVLRFLTGLFISGSSSTVYAYLGEFHNTKNRTRVIMAASTIFGLFCILMPVLAWAILSTTWTLNFSMIGITYKPWRFFLVVCGLPDLFCAISFFWLPESPKFILAQGHQTDTVNIIRQIYSINTGKSRETLKICAIVHEDESLSSRKTNEENYGLRLLRSIYDQTTPIFMGDHLKKTLILCTLQLWMFFTANGMYMFFPDILNRVALHRSRSGDNYTATICQAITETTIDIKDIVMEDNTSCELRLDSTAFNHTLAVEVLYFIGFILIGIMISKVGKLTILIFVFMGSGICGIAIVFTTLPTLSTYLYVILLLCGLTMNVINGVTIDLFPTHLRAMSVSISLMVGRLGSVFGSNLVATILEYNCEATFLISGISLMLCGILTIFIPNIHARPNKRLPKNNLSISSGELQ